MKTPDQATHPTAVSEHTGLILPGPAIALSRLLDVEPPDLDAADPLPLAWHWVYLLDSPAQHDLGPDGTPFRNTIVQPVPGMRRIWAGGQVAVRGGLRCGEYATRRAWVVMTERKQGRAGPLVVATVRHEIEQARHVVIRERRDILYHGATLPREAAREPAGALTLDDWSVDVTPTLLFRFSALTYNAHRIHYDRDYARDVEGYPGLVVQGPLQAIVMAEAARSRGLPAAVQTNYDYRLVAPLIESQGLVASADIGADPVETTVRDLSGRLTAHGSIRTVRDA